MPPPYTCYLIISPDPRAQETLWVPDPRSSGTNRIIPAWDIKFGDGPRNSAYKTANPSHSYVENHSAPANNLTVRIRHRNGTTSLDRRQPGKFLEWVILKYASQSYVEMQYDSIPDAGTEWHRLYLRYPNRLNEMRATLIRMLELFPSIIMWTWKDGTPPEALAPEVAKQKQAMKSAIRRDLTFQEETQIESRVLNDALERYYGDRDMARGTSPQTQEFLNLVQRAFGEWWPYIDKESWNYGEDVLQEHGPLGFFRGPLAGTSSGSDVARALAQSRRNQPA